MCVCVCVNLSVHACMCSGLHLHWTRAVLWRVHPSPVGNEVQDFLITTAGIGHVTQGEDLPQEDPKGPEEEREGD